MSICNLEHENDFDFNLDTVTANTILTDTLGVSGNIPSTSTSTGSIVCTGGIGCGGDIYASDIYSQNYSFIQVFSLNKNTRAVNIPSTGFMVGTNGLEWTIGFNKNFHLDEDNLIIYDGSDSSEATFLVTYDISVTTPSDNNRIEAAMFKDNDILNNSITTTSENSTMETVRITSRSFITTLSRNSKLYLCITNNTVAGPMIPILYSITIIRLII